MKSKRTSKNKKGGRRLELDRREFSFTAYGPDRRNVDERRKHEDRRQKPRI